jgi:predicted negative regulator of RcsB-dependent stress response
MSHHIPVSARVELKQVYSNTSKLKNATAQYIFPVPANAAVCAFQMKSVNGRSIQAVVKKLDEARAEYEDAIANDQWAGLLQQLTGDVFCLSVGAIPAKQDITVSITVCTTRLSGVG